MDPLDRRIGLINQYISTLTNGTVRNVVEVSPGLFRVDFRANAAKIRLQVELKTDSLLLYSTLFNLSDINPEHRYELFERLLKLNSTTETMSAKFAISNEEYVEVMAARKDLKDLDYGEFLSMLRNVCNVAGKQGAEIATHYMVRAPEQQNMQITPLDEQ